MLLNICQISQIGSFPPSSGEPKMYLKTNNLIPFTILKKLKSHNPPPAPSSSPGSSLGCHDFVIGGKGFQLAVAVFRGPGSAEVVFFPTDWTDGTCDSVVSLEMSCDVFCRNVFDFPELLTSPFATFTILSFGRRAWFYNHVSITCPWYCFTDPFDGSHDFMDWQDSTLEKSQLRRPIATNQAVHVCFF